MLKFINTNTNLKNKLSICVFLFFSINVVYGKSIDQGKTLKESKIIYAKKILQVCEKEQKTRVRRVQYSPLKASFTDAEIAEGNTELADCLVKTFSTQQQSQNSDRNRGIRVALTESYDGLSNDLEFDLVYPLWERIKASGSLWETTKGGRKHALSLQPGFILSVFDDSAKKQVGGSVGIVYRFTVSHGIVGLNLFYDQNIVKNENLSDKNFKHNRPSLGVDYQRKGSYLSVNYYFAEDDWQTVSEFQQQKAAGGYDLYFKQKVTNKWDLSTQFTYIDYGEKSDEFISTVGGEYKVNCYTTLGAYVSHTEREDDTDAILSLRFDIGGPKKRNKKDCSNVVQQDETDLYRIVQREKKIPIEMRDKPAPPSILKLYRLPSTVTDLYEVDPNGDPNSDTVIVFAQEGPVTALGVGGWLSDFTAFQKYHIVSAHQVQTLFPQLFTKKDWTSKALENELSHNVEILDRVIKHFKAQNKRVVVMGQSYGAFVVTNYLARRGLVAADHYVITAGRLSMPKTFYEPKLKALDPNWNEIDYVFDSDGITPVMDTDPLLRFEDDGTTPRNPTEEKLLERRIRILLTGLIAKQRYTQLLAEIDLSKVTYGHNRRDDAVGTLTAEEVAFLKSRGAQVIYSDIVPGHIGVLTNPLSLLGIIEAIDGGPSNP